MPFKKGKAKTGGRTKGAVNKATQDIKEKFSQLLDGYSVEKMVKDLEQLEPKDRLDIVVKLKEFFVPKLQRSEIKAEVTDTTKQTMQIGGKTIEY